MLPCSTTTHDSFAHIFIDAAGELCAESLREHLEETARLAQIFAQKFALGKSTKLVAKFHDLGKFSKEFQAYLWQGARETEEATSNAQRHSHGPDHSTAGARFLAQKIQKNSLGSLLAYAVAGHHAGLPNGIDSGNASLEHRLYYKEIRDWESSALKNLPPEFIKVSETDSVEQEILSILRNSQNPKFALAFAVRMIFSCLVDADFLATEKFMNPGKSDLRELDSKQTIPTLENRLVTSLQRFNNPTTPIGIIRNEIREDCLAAAELPPGIFQLTVPTGGGKTLSSLAFALKHARIHGMDRVIYVIPFTSIIEQNAEVFRKELGTNAVVEHHCNIEVDDGAGTGQSKLATENWDAPIVVTTNVQFFESLFSHKPSRSRKLHNIAKSVIILDEAQALPVEFLRPCLHALDELSQNYASSIVLCTATQPAIDSEKIENGLCGNAHGIRKIIEPNRNLHERLRRVSVKKLEETLELESLSQKLLQERQVLAIVNTRDEARELFEKLKSSTATEEKSAIFHLSAAMCPEHRKSILDTIRETLRENKPCRVVSTQLIEAGVDVDFPCVYRALSGIDSIAQAAGRCNREGKISHGGRVYIFETKKLPPSGFLRTAANCGKQVLALDDYGNDPLSEKSVEKYFELMYWFRENELDKFDILKNLTPGNKMLGFRFRDIGELFNLIEENTETVIVPFGENGRKLCERLRETFNPTEQRMLARKLQRYAVSIYKNRFAEATAAGQIQLVHNRYALLVSTELHYDKNFGLCFDKTQQPPALFL